MWKSRTAEFLETEYLTDHLLLFRQFVELGGWPSSTFTRQINAKQSRKVHDLFTSLTEGKAETGTVQASCTYLSSAKEAKCIKVGKRGRKAGRWVTRRGGSSCRSSEAPTSSTFPQVALSYQVTTDRESTHAWLPQPLRLHALLFRGRSGP